MARYCESKRTGQISDSVLCITKTTPSPCWSVFENGTVKNNLPLDITISWMLIILCVVGDVFAVTVISLTRKKPKKARANAAENNADSNPSRQTAGAIVRMPLKIRGVIGSRQRFDLLVL